MNKFLAVVREGNGSNVEYNAEYKEVPLWHHEQGLSYTASGYGAKTPSRYKVKIGSRWYRVYSACYGNASSEYVTVKGQRLYVSFY
jgi:hypothetical protein